jgi:hypothetical protein
VPPGARLISGQCQRITPVAVPGKLGDEEGKQDEVVVEEDECGSNRRSREDGAESKFSRIASAQASRMGQKPLVGPSRAATVLEWWSCPNEALAQTGSRKRSGGGDEDGRRMKLWREVKDVGSSSTDRLW